MLEFEACPLAGHVAGIFRQTVFSSAILAAFQIEAAPLGDGDEAAINQIPECARCGSP